MSYTTETTWVAGNVLTAAQLNTYVRDNVTWLATDAPTCRIFNSTNFAHNSSGNWLSITYDSERWDNAAMHDTATNTSRITIPTGGGGKYLIGGTFLWAASATGVDRLFRILGGGVTVIAITNSAKDSTNASEITISAPWSTAAAEFWEIQGNQNSGGTLNVSFIAAETPEMWAFWFRT